MPRFVMINALIAVSLFVSQQSLTNKIVSSAGEDLTIEASPPSNLDASLVDRMFSKKLGKLRFVTVSGCGKTRRTLDAESYREWRTSLHKDDCVLAEAIKIGQYRLLRVAGQSRPEWRTVPDHGRISDILRSIAFFHAPIFPAQSRAMVTLFLRSTARDLLDFGERAYRILAGELGPSYHLRIHLRTDDCFGGSPEYPTGNVFADHSTCPLDEGRLGLSVVCGPAGAGPRCRLK